MLADGQAGGIGGDDRAGLANCATRASSARLISRFSATTSMIQSASAQSFKSSSKLPVTMRFSRPRVKNAAGLRLDRGGQAGANDAVADVGTCEGQARASLVGRKLRRRDIQQRAPDAGIGECAAMRAPMVPAPRTTTFSIDRFIGVSVISVTACQSDAQHAGT